jgi:hypothetical protein
MVQEVQIRNSGTAPLRIGDIAISGKQAEAFRLGGHSCSRTVLPPGALCSVPVTFVPRQYGRYAAQLLINNDAVDSPQRVLLSGEYAEPYGGRPDGPDRHDGTSVVPAIELNARNLNFRVGETHQIIIRNAGLAPLGMSSIVTSGDKTNSFRISQDACSNRVLPPGSRCVVSIRFLPRQYGRYSAELTVNHNAAGSPQRVKLSGEYLAPPIGG